MPQMPIPRELVDPLRIDELVPGDSERTESIKNTLGFGPEGGQSQLAGSSTDMAARLRGAMPMASTVSSRAASADDAERQVKRRRSGRDSLEQDPRARGTKRGGSSTADLENETRQSEGQYVQPWRRPPHWMPSHLVQPWGVPYDGVKAQMAAGSSYHDAVPRSSTCDAAQRTASGRTRQSEGGHLLDTAGPLVYCTRCARYANARLGAGLKGPCKRPERATHSAVASRLRRLSEGLHPITGHELTQ